MQRFRALCRRYADWIAITLALLVCQRWWMARNRPERLLELPEGYEFTRLHDGLLYMKKNDPVSFQQSMTRVRRPGSSRLIPVMTNIKAPAAPALFTMSVSGGPLHPVLPDSLEAASSDTLFPSGTDTYRVEYRKTTPGLVSIPPGYGTGVGFATGVGAVGTARPPAPPPAPKPPFHTVIYREEADSVEAALHRVSASGESPAAALTLPMGYIAQSHIRRSGTLSAIYKSSIAFSGNAVYWIKGFPDQTAYRESSNGQTVGRGVSTYRSAVLTMPLQGGRPRALLDNVPSDTTLFASEDGVLCRVNKSGGSEWLRLRPDGAVKRILADYRGYQDPVECGHHFYWAQSPTASIYRPEATNIIEANADGSHVHTLYTLNDRSEVWVYSWRGRAYFHTLTAATSQQPAYKAALYRIYPASGAKRLCALPDNTMQIVFDGAYVYGLAREEKTSVLDTFRSESAGRPCLALYRYRLPDK